jgi:hypothetical protein
MYFSEQLLNTTRLHSNIINHRPQYEQRYLLYTVLILTTNVSEDHLIQASSLGRRLRKLRGGKAASDVTNRDSFDFCSIPTISEVEKVGFKLLLLF